MEVYYFLACYGLTFAICDASIFDRPRAFLRRWKFIADLLACYFCTGFWVSLVIYLAIFGHTMKAVDFPTVAGVVAHAFAGAAFCYLTYIVVDYVELSMFEKHLRVKGEDGAREGERYSDGE